MKALLLLSMIIIVTSTYPSATLAANGGLHPDNVDCIAEYKKWKKAKGWRALAVSDPIKVNGAVWQMCSFTVEAPSKKAAIQRVLAFCNSVVFQNSIKSKCRVTEVSK